MARKNVLFYEVESAKSLAASFNSKPTLIKYLDNASYQINVTTSSSTGTFAVEVSNDYTILEPTNDVTDAGTWTALTLSGVPFVAAANDSIVIDLKQLPFNAIRVAYTSTIAGTGSCDIFVGIKQVGA